MHLLTPGTSTATGFSQKTCLPASTAARRCMRAEVRRRREQHDVDVADHALVGVEAGEACVRRDVDPVADVRGLEAA